MGRFNRALALLAVATVVVTIAGAVWLVGDGFGLAGEVEVRYVQGPLGPPGPAGPQGERGATGATGGQGATGAAGQDIVVEKEVPVVVVKEVVVEKVIVVEVPVTVHRHVSTRCTGGPAAWIMERYASNDGVRWTADGSHLLLTYNAEVWAVTADGSRLWRLVQAWRELVPGDGYPIGWMTSFDVTRDGKQVIYASCAFLPDVPRARLAQLDQYDFDYELAVVGLDGKAPWRLTRHLEFDNYPAWSPDGARVAFVSDRHMTEAEKRRGNWPPPSLYTMTADGTDIRRLATDLGVALQPPAWSPDGRTIAVAARLVPKADHALYVVQADGSGFVRLADAVSGGSWSPDGTRLAFAQPFGAEIELYTIAADGSDAQRVTTIFGWQRGSGVPDARQAWIPTLAWSPDGSKLLYSCGYRQFCVVTLDGEPVGATVTLRGQPVGESPLLGSQAAWSPDGARIAVTSLPKPRIYNGIILYTAAPDGSDRQTLAWRGVGLVAAQARAEDLAASQAACTAGYVVPAPDINPGLVRDCETLLAAREALFGRLLVNWGSDSPLARWEGVTVAGAPPRVTGLDLRDKNLGFSLSQTHGGLSLGSPGHGGTIPVELAALERLQHLDLSHNTLNGPIPAELENLTHLKALRLHNHWHLTGCIPMGLKRVPDNDLAELGLPDCEAGS